MKMCLLICLVLATVVCVAHAQPPRDGRRPGPPPPDPILELFDANQDGRISEKEIDDAAVVLKKLDRDGNGVLTREELPRPPRPEDGDHDRPEWNRPSGDGRGGDRDVRLENAPKGTVIFSGGYETDREDRGRPVVLIAAALGVKPAHFRDAFSGVNPSREGDPSPALARANKKVLMDALGKRGITNERLDTVSNYYRYNGGRGELWKRSPARAMAIIKNGKLTGFKIVDGGAGYSSEPRVNVAGYEDVKVKATIEFSMNFKSNGRVTSLTVVKGD